MGGGTLVPLHSLYGAMPGQRRDHLLTQPSTCRWSGGGRCMDRVWDAASTLACGPTWVPTGLPMHPILRAAPMIDMGQSVHFASACAPILGADGWIFPLRSAILEESS